MKKLIIFILLLSSTLYAVDAKVTALDELTAILGTDILYVIDDPGGTPLSKKITATNLFDMIDTFSELNTIVADKTLVNEEDAAAWDALITFNLGLTITTGDPFTLGANRIDNGSDLLDGEQIAADTIDNDSIDWGDMTDLTTDGAVSWGNIAEGELANSTVVTTDIKDGEVALADLAAAAYAKDLVTTSPITGAADNIFVGADSDVTVALDFTAAWDFGGATSIEIVNSEDPDVDANGEVSQDTDGANEAGDVSFRGFAGANQFLIARKLKTIQATIMNPQDLDDGERDLCPIWHNNTGMVFTITEIWAWSDTDNTTVTVEVVTATDWSSPGTVDALEIAADGTSVYTDTETTISDATIAHDEIITLDFDDTDDPGVVKINIIGWLGADVD